MTVIKGLVVKFEILLTLFSCSILKNSKSVFISALKPSNVWVVCWFLHTYQFGLEKLFEFISFVEVKAMTDNFVGQ